jgi:hypothetical protein
MIKTYKQDAKAVRGATKAPRTTTLLGGISLFWHIPGTPVDEAQHLPGQGEVFNYVNSHGYSKVWFNTPPDHRTGGSWSAGNNPVKYTDPDGKEDEIAISAADPSKFDKPWYGKIPIVSDFLSGTYFFARNTLGGEGYHDIAYDPIKNEMAMPKDQQMEAFSSFMTAASTVAGAAQIGNTTKSSSYLQNLADTNLASKPHGLSLFRTANGNIRLEQGVESVNRAVQNELGVKVGGAIEKPLHLVINGNEIRLNPFNSLWKFFPKK